MLASDDLHGVFDGAFGGGFSGAFHESPAFDQRSHGDVEGALGVGGQFEAAFEEVKEQGIDPDGGNGGLLSGGELMLRGSALMVDCSFSCSR